MEVDLTLTRGCDTVEGGRLGSPGRLHLVDQWPPKVFQSLAVIFLLFIFTFKVGKSGKNSIDYVGGASDHCNDNFHYHASLLQSSIPTGAGRVEETNRQESQALPMVLF